MDIYNWIDKLLDTPEQLTKYITKQQLDEVLAEPRNVRVDAFIKIIGFDNLVMKDYKAAVFGIGSDQWNENLRGGQMALAAVYIGAGKVDNGFSIDYKEWVLNIHGSVSFRAAYPVKQWFLGYMLNPIQYTVLLDVGNEQTITLNQVRMAVRQPLYIEYNVCYVY